MTVEKVYTQIDCCRVCKGRELILFWSGDEQYIVDFPREVDVDLPKAPLTLARCRTCSTVQLFHTVNQDVLYKEFFYRSGINELMRAALLDVVLGASQQVVLREGDNVLDIGCNDGTLLKNYPKIVNRYGVDPAQNIQQEGKQDGGWIFINDYFKAGLLGDKRFKIITAVAMFYDLPNPVEFCREVVASLTYDGVFVVQMNYLGSMLKTNGIDNVSHEHLCYYSLFALQHVFLRAGLKIFNVELNAVNGGSIRVYACKEGVFAREEEPAVIKLLREEMHAGYDHPEIYLNFMAKVRANCETLNVWLKELALAGKKIYCYGASTRGTTLLQFLDVKGKVLGAAERDTNKFGRYMVGSWLPIRSEEFARFDAEYFLCLPWHFWQAIKQREKRWMMNGGKFIVPLPEPKIIGCNKDGLFYEMNELSQVLEQAV